MILSYQQWNMLNGGRGIAGKFAGVWDDLVITDDDPEGVPGIVGVPYNLSDSFTGQQKQRILASMKEFEDNTCIRQVKYAR